MRNVVLLAAVVLAVAGAVHFAFDASRAGQPSVLLVLGITYVVLGGLAVTYAHRDGVLRQWLSAKFGDFTRGVAAAGVLFGAAYVFTKIVTPAGTTREIWLTRIYLQFGEPELLRKNVSGIVAAIVITAAAEEIVWRGLVTSLLEERIGSRRAWVWAAALYALAHVPTMWQLRIPNGTMNPLVVLAALGCGLVWGAMTRVFGRLLPAIIAHAFFDWTILMMFRLWGPSV